MTDNNPLERRAIDDILHRHVVLWVDCSTQFHLNTKHPSASILMTVSMVHLASNLSQVALDFF